MGGTEALAAFLTWGAAWALVRGGVGLQKEEGNLARTGWLKACTFLARSESLWMKKSQEAEERVAFSLPTCL